MAVLTPQFYELLEADQKEIFFRRRMMLQPVYPEVFDVRTSMKAYEDRLRIGGLGTMRTKPEGTPVAFDDPVQGARVRTVHATAGLAVRFTMEMMQDDLFGVMDRMTEELQDADVDHDERLCWSFIDDAWTGTTFTVLESEALFSTTHSNIKDGTTQSNTLSPAVELGVTGLEAILTLMRTTTGDEGRYLNLRGPSKLVIHPNLEHQAHVLLNTQYQVDTANNNVSTVVASRSQIAPVVVPYKSSQTNWSVHAPPGENTLQLNVRMATETSSAVDPDTKDMKEYAVKRTSVQGSEWRGHFGSNYS
jgi:hypothetical protein